MRIEKHHTPQLSTRWDRDALDAESCLAEHWWQTSILAFAAAALPTRGHGQTPSIGALAGLIL